MPKKIRYGMYTGLVLCMTILFCIIQGRTENVQATAVGIVHVEGVLNVRKGPGKSYGLVKTGGTTVTLTDRQRVTITAKNGEWYHIKFVYNSNNLTGYVYKNYIGVQTGEVCISVTAKVSEKSINIRKTASSKGAYVKEGTKKVAFANGTKLNVKSEKLVSNQKWYYVSGKYSGKTYKGYVKSEDITVDYGKGIPGICNEVTPLYKAAGKTSQVLYNNKKVSINAKRQVTVLSESIVSGKKYFRVKILYTSSKWLNGYVNAENVAYQIVKNEKTAAATPQPSATKKPEATATPTATSTPKPSETAAPTTTPSAAPLTDAEFEKKLKKEGFTESYIKPLLALHKKYPYWEFKAYNTGLKWSTVIKKETKVGLNLLSNNKDYAWKSTEDGAYDWTKDKYIPYDGSTWVTASAKAVKYYMDPRNFLDERGIFQFENLEYQSEFQTQAGVEKVLSNTPMHTAKFDYQNSEGSTTSIKYSKAFVKAAEKSKVSPYHLASRVKQEVVINSTLMSSSVSGKVKGYEGIFNFYNIGANNSTVAGGAIANGLHWASTGSTYQRPWNNRYKSIIGGAQYIGKNYINVGQNTLYLEKFNVTSKNRYEHQYMSNVEAPNSEATKTVSAYGTIDADMQMTFSIPVYTNMPDEACEVPSGGKNPNNYLKTLYIANHAFSSPFKLGDDGSKTYKVTVGNNVESIKIVATKVSTHATLTGKGTKTLAEGVNKFTVKVTSASGKARKYNIEVTRAAVKQ